MWNRFREYVIKRIAIHHSIGLARNLGIKKQFAAQRYKKMVQSDILQNTLSFRLGQAYFAYKNLLDAKLKKHELGRVLPGGTSALWIYILANAGCTPTAAVNDLGLSKSTVSSQVDQLEARGLVERRPSSVDGRSVLLHPTSKSKAYTDEVAKLANEVESLICAELDDPSKSNLVTNLAIVAQSANRG